MLDFTYKDITKYYAKIKKLAIQSYSKGNYEKTLNRIEFAAKFVYNFNFIYADQELEDLLTNISSKIIRQETKIEFIDNNRFVFYDAFVLGNRVLTRQYVRALISNNCEFLFVFEDYKPSEGKNILEELNAYNKCEVFLVDQTLSKTEQIKSIYHKICEYRPQKALLQLLPWSVVATCVFNALPTVKRYQINLTDHAFWLGVNCIDYNIEFRQYGATVSVEKRNIPKERLILLRYYPIMDDVEPFKGFPELCKNKVVIFSGSAYYKIYGEQKKYFEIVKTVLDDNPSAILLFAGGGDDKPIKQFIRTNNLQERFILLGYRKDINAVFANCDIYLGTYPMGGGLMEKYAAINAKPKLEISNYTSLDDFYAEAKKLINNKEYREEAGNLLKKEFLPTVHNFNTNFKTAILNHNTTPNFEFTPIYIDYKNFTDLYLEVDNKFLHHVQYITMRMFK